ncbi:MAG: DNA primase [Proteobacteria bacterium]|nr:DNA primase [Pseudomonadota bacterium]MBU1687536.1 DNA primase [Pseudomonadota bacterium]
MTASSFQENAVQQVKDAANIVEIVGEHVQLKKAGATYKGLCPFHGEKTPSFNVNPNRNSYHCFGCSEGGDVIDFYMKYHNVTFPEALKALAQRYGIVLPEKALSHEERARANRRTDLYTVLQDATLVFHTLLLDDPRAAGARKYLEDREIPDNVIRDFQLGYAPDSWDLLVRRYTKPEQLDLATEAGLLVKKDQGGWFDRFRNRLLCPIMTTTGQVAGFSGRILGDGQPKYLNSSENQVYDKSSLLFGLFQNRKSIREHDCCILVEGNFDLLAMAAKGLNYAAAPLGTALTRKQIRTIKGYAGKIILLFDGDQAGMKAAGRSVPLFLAEQVDARICLLPEGEDPDSFVRRHGPERLTKILENSMALPEYLFQRWAKLYGLGLTGKGKIVTELQTLAKDLDDSHAQKTVFLAHFSQKLGIPLDRLTTTTKASHPSPPTGDNRGVSQLKTTTFTLPLKQKQLLEFLIIFPEYLQKFREAGIEQVITSQAGKKILSNLIALKSEGALEPERLLDLVEGAERSFISRLLVASPDYSDEEREKQAVEKLDWLEKNRFKILQQDLTQRIDEAQKTGNIPLCLELIARKKALKETIQHGDQEPEA